ncbi:restriction endonuclease [Ligilactobacillus pabuli]|uniref:Restriction endonuclease n=1 Tax=Ligilactobacillus pabuli TaxID=2886039 RepID=A0ABQ5JIP2_9LACO|nr:Eco57I restriction-modification methylase domain-containing protein [Ligilactobacillus pabuli]GKS80591.1 restriction endonuclease [Ligilactobacillus pabuli]
MPSNFEFLKLNFDEELQKLYPLAHEIEVNYEDEAYSSVIRAVRPAAEHAARLVADQHFYDGEIRDSFNDVLRWLKQQQIIPRNILELFYDLKSKGNQSSHNALTQFTKNEALDSLREIYAVLIWLVNQEYEQNVVANFREPVKEKQYQTMAERKMIYVQTADNEDGDWPAYEGLEKIGEASASADEMEADWRPNSQYLRSVADKRIRQYMKTAGVPYLVEWTELAWNKNKKEWFHDYDVHEVLKRSNYEPSGKVTGNEWYQVDLQTAKAAIKAVKNGQESIAGPKVEDKIELRLEQKDAVSRTRKIFKKPGKMLWNAKMRFGKTVTALELIKEEEYQKVLIMTHRPVVSDSWFEDFGKMKMKDAGYQYGSKEKGETLANLVKSESSFIYFASIQDLRGSTAAGGKQGDKNELIFDTKWDLVIIDEAHEGTKTDLAHNVLDLVTNKETRTLELSGTPFNLIDDYDEDHVYTWDYVMEQNEKLKWNAEYPNEKNPYEKLPKVSMYTFAMKNRQYLDESKSFNFKEFFRTEEDGTFTHENDVNNFLNEITKQDSQTNYPYSTQAFRDELRHTLWLVPGVKEAKALTDLLRKHPVFGKEYKIINIVDNDTRDDVESAEKHDRGQSDVNRVREVITDKPYETKTITITVRRLTTGVNVPEWTAIMFLNNTTSAMQYLQAAFRAQTPYSDQNGMKENCYIFDFAPDRALTVMAESTSLSTGAGKLVSSEQREQMGKLLNFLPIIGAEGNGMNEFKVDSLLTKIKRVYAEKAVRSGFDDDSLYSDELLKLDEADVSQFKDLQAIIGSTKKTKVENKVDVNHQGLTDEEYEQATKGKRKKKRERSPEEKAAIEHMNSLKKQKKTMISVLRGISIRIPLMIYGMKTDLTDDITIDKFVNLVDDQSWQEFMPQGVTKGEFAKFKKYYDPQVFIEAGRIIRNKVKELDRMSPNQRTEELALIFGTFKNPDKETVLTPWNVVNRHLASTIGGLSFYDENFETMRDGNTPLNHWVETAETKEVFKPDTKILEINSKTGLYPLYAAASLFSQAFDKLNSDRAGKFTAKDEDDLWQEILKKNIYVVAKTPMAKTIAERTLAGYRNFKVNVQFIDGIVETAKENIEVATQKVKEAFNDMKFDVVIGNPPYQEETAKKETANGQKTMTNVFQHFQVLADNLAIKYTSLIYPGGRWIHQSGKGMKKFGLNQINDPNLATIIYYPDAAEIFKSVAIPDGISIVFKDKSKNKKSFKYIYIQGSKKIVKEIKAPGEKLLPLNPNDMSISIKIDNFVKENKLDFLSNSIFPRNLFGIESDFVEKNPQLVRSMSENSTFNRETEIKLFTNDKAGKSGRAKWFIANREIIEENKNLISEFQVIVSSANAGGQKRDNQISIVDNYSAFGRSRLALKSFNTKKEAQNFLKYANSNLIKFAFLLTDESLSSLAKSVPDILDYTKQNSIIDFEKDIDEQFVKILSLTDSEIEHITQRLKNVR